MKMIRSIRKIYEDEEGSILPLISVILIIFILVGSYELGNIFVYRDRTVIRDALDSAVTSALASATQVHNIDTYYSEYAVPKTDDKGNVVGYYWVPTESNSKNYIYIDQATAQATAKQYFNDIISKNNVKASLVSWNFSVQYDDGRYVNVIKARANTSNPSSWWTELGDSVPNSWAYGYETKAVRFPRYVKVNITASVNVPVVLGGVFGKSNQSFSWTSSGIKELSSDKVN